MNDKAKYNFALIGAVAFGVALWFLLSTTEARPHEAPLGWIYPASCCSGRDCAEAPQGAVKEGPDGYEVTLHPGQHPMVKDKPHSFVVPYNARQIRDSPDGREHVCLSTSLRLLCLFVGARGY